MALVLVGCGAPFESARLALVEEPDGAVPVLPAPDALAGRTGAGGGQNETGGSPGSGGSVVGSSGGAAQATGGTTPETGGYASTGGSNASGGLPQSGTGGSDAGPATGGQVATGGTQATGGVPSTGGAPPVTGGASGTGGAGGCDPNVWPPEKVCGGVCVSSDIMHGCQTTSCSPCPAPFANGVATCSATSGFCSFVCFSGYHPAASATPMCIQ